MRIGIVGTGLIGGSLLLALRERGVELVAIESDARTRTALAALGLEHVYETPAEELRACSAVVLALPLPGILEQLGPVGDLLSGSNAVLTDVGGAKATVCEQARRVVPRSVTFIGGHPMAGRERGGFTQALPQLFDGRAVALTPAASAAEEAVALVRGMWELVGAHVLTTTPEAHDDAVARISHMPYFAACATAAVADAGDSLAHALAATGLRDTTRIATDATIRFAAYANPSLPERLRDVARWLDEAAQALEQAQTVADEKLDAARDARLRLYPPD